MDCPDIKRAMHEYLDNPCDEYAKQLVDQHISHCLSCKQHFAELGRVLHSVSQMEWKRAPVDFTASFMKGLSYPPVWIRRDWRYGVMRGVGIAASVALLIGLGAWWSVPQGFSISASEPKRLVISNHSVIVPKGEVYRGDLVIQNGDAVIEGKVNGSVTALGGRIIEKAGADITGNREEIVDSSQWVMYYAKKIWNTLTMGVLTDKQK